MLGSVLATMNEAYMQFNSSTRDEAAQREFRLSLLKTDALGKRIYGKQFVQAANSRFAYDFDYALAVERASVALGCDAIRDAKNYAGIQTLLHAPSGPDLPLALLLVLEATSLESFADAFWDADIGHYNMWNLTEVELYELGMNVQQVEDYSLYTWYGHPTPKDIQRPRGHPCMY